MRVKEAEVLSRKTVVQSIDILKLLLTEHEKTMDSLERELKEKKISIEHLQCRLHRNNLDSSVDLKKHEIFVPGHDKEVLGELLRENVRLRTVLNLKYSSEEVFEATKTIDALRAKITQLSADLFRKNKELTEYLEATNSSDSEKDVAIKRLTSELRECYGQRSHADDVLRTLNHQVGLMRSKIDDLSSENVDLAKELRDRRRKERDLGELRGVGRLSLEDQWKTLEEQRSRLVYENTQLSEQIKDVLAMNTRWQRYSDQREAHVIKLTGENQVLSGQNKKLEEDSKELRAQNKTLEKDCEELRKRLLEHLRFEEKHQPKEESEVRRKGEQREEEEPLRCPSCFKEYSIMEHASLMEHVIDCADIHDEDFDKDRFL